MCCYVCTAFLRKNGDWSINNFNFYYYRSFHIVSLRSAYFRKKNEMVKMCNISRDLIQSPLKYEIQKIMGSYYFENGKTLCSTDFIMQQILERRCKLMPCRDARKYFLKWKNQINHESPVSLLNLCMLSVLFLVH